MKSTIRTEGELRVTKDEIDLWTNFLLKQNRRFLDYINPTQIARSPVLQAASCCRIKTLETLLKFDADINVVYDLGNRLYSAISSTRLDLCRLLVGYNIDVNYASKTIATPLINATGKFKGKDKVEAVKLLLEHGADPNQSKAIGVGYMRQTALVAAVKTVSEETRNEQHISVAAGTRSRVLDATVHMCHIKYPHDGTAAARRRR